jgi:hypothetical protein
MYIRVSAQMKNGCVGQLCACDDNPTKRNSCERDLREKIPWAFPEKILWVALQRDNQE